MAHDSLLLLINTFILQWVHMSDWSDAWFFQLQIILLSTLIYHTPASYTLVCVRISDHFN